MAAWRGRTAGIVDQQPRPGSRQLAREVVHHDPDHAAARGLLGQVRYVDHHLRCRIVERADGVPLYAEELTRAVLDSGALDEETPETLIPATLQGSLTARLERALDVNANLLERVLQGSSMEMIASLVETVLPDPIVIVDLTTDAFHVGRSPDAERFSDREWGELVRGPAARSIRHLVQQSEPSDFRRLQRIDLRSTGAPFERDAYVEPLQLDRETVGGVVVFPRQRGLDDLDVLIAMEVKFALSVQLMRTHVHQQSADVLLTELFARLFEGDWPDARQIVNRAARLGIDVARPALLVGIVLLVKQRAVAVPARAAVRAQVAVPARVPAVPTSRRWMPPWPLPNSARRASTTSGSSASSTRPS